ncbi:Prominin [Plasmopara halstedii]|uniref:Prominin n=1 Tax=Plasmopara halstedii TaxID=4781 RepID=A0A0P1A5Y1_PLAHL|nr:Prominin [Plasmopara halstedii]CEG35967.1 Prominin [Plasmopara halstedii]|eukprot:XP_024572336.1 Prominin [Plasmopara halstedii]
MKRPYQLVVLALLASSAVSLAQTTQQSFADMSKLRGLKNESYIQPQDHLVSSALVRYRRLEGTSTEADASAQANQVGASVRKAIKQLRGGTDKFYQDLITAVKITLCEQNLAKNKIRFVSCDADNAYKDDNGDPERLPVTSLTDDETVNAYNQGLCEVAPNCYWAEIVDGDTSRAKMYAYPDSTMDSTAATAKIKEWATGVIGFVIPGIVLGVLSLLTMVFFLICRCCCNRCGGRFPREEGYKCMEKFLPLLFFLLFAIGVVVVSAAAFLYRGTMLVAVDDLFNATSGTLENGSEWIANIRTPLVEIAATVVDSADDIKVKLDGTDFIDTGLTDLTTKLEDFGDKYSTAPKFPANCVPDPSKTNAEADGDPCYECKACTAIGTKAQDAATQVNKNAGPGSVQSAVDAQVSMANTLITTVDNTQADVDGYDSQFQGYRDQLGYAIMALFALALVVIVVGFIGILFGLTPLKLLANIMHIAYFFGFFALILVFIISAVVLAIGVVLGDACEVTAIFSSNWTVPLGDSAKAVDACFQNQSLIDVFNLSDKLSFARGGIEFPKLDVSAMFDFSDLDALETSTNDIDEGSFGFDKAAYSSLVTTFNSYAVQTSPLCNPAGNGYQTTEHLRKPWLANNQPQPGSGTEADYIENYYKSYDSSCTNNNPNSNTPNFGKAYACATTPQCAFSVFMREKYTVILPLATLKASMESFKAELSSDVNGITSTSDTFETKTKKLNSDIEGIKAQLDSSLIGYVGDFEEAMYCTFIADGFWTIYDALCGDLMPSITMIALMLFLCGIFLMPVNVCLIIGVKRLKAHGNGNIMDAEFKFK